MSTVAPFVDLLEHVVDNRGRTCPTSTSGTPLIATNCVKDTTLFPVFEKVRYVDEATMSTWFRGHPEPGDILFVCKGSPGQTCIVPEPVNFCIAQDMVAVRADKNKIYPAYLFAALRSPVVQSQIANMHVGTMIPHFKKGDFDKLLIPLPDEATQIAIGDLYLRLSEKIDLNRRMNETLEAQARALFRDWFVDFGPVKAKMAGDTPYLAPDLWSLFPSRVDDDGVPEGWEAAMLDAFAISQNRKANPEEVDEGTAYIGLEHMPRRSIALAEWEGAEKVTSAKSRFKRREILFGKLRPYFHKVGIAPIDGICSTDIVVLAPKKQRFEALTLACVSTDEFVAFTDQSSTGTKMPRTSWKIMRTYPMVKPDDAVADAFQQLCAPMFDRILANIGENQSFAQTRDLLLPKLMSGEIRVCDAASEELSAA